MDSEDMSSGRAAVMEFLRGTVSAINPRSTAAAQDRGAARSGMYTAKLERSVA